jgi:SPP1 gp7 family putative phage head morphogenesis protein
MPDPEVIQVMRQFKASLLAGEQSQMQEMARRWLAVERRLQGQMDALALEMTQIKQDGGTVSVETLLNQTRYRELMTQLSSELETYSGYVERSITDRQGQLVRLGVKHAEQAITSQGLTGAFNRLPIEAVEHLAGFASNGSPLNRLLMLSWPDAAAGLTQELITGVALGYNPRKTAKMMAQGMTGSLDRMMTIARTEQLRAYRSANLESYRASGVVTQYKRLATHDSRVCAGCLMAEGTVSELSEVMATHPNCRCTMVPIVRGLPSPQWKQGQEWFEEQDQATQMGILGKGKYYAWQNGDYDLGELVKVVPNITWGDTLQTRTLGELTGPRVVMPVAVPVAPRVPRGVILETDGPIARAHLSDYERIPEALRDAVADKGVRTYISNDRTLPDMDDMMHLRGVRPRGWPEGSTWDIVPGGYDHGNKAVIAGSGNHGSSSLLLHEFGHSLGDVFQYTDDVRLIELHKAQHWMLDPYLQQGGPGGEAGRSEFLAEAFAQTLMDRTQADFKYGMDMVGFIFDVVLKGEKAILQ